MARFIEGGIWIGAVNIDIQTSMFVLEKKFFQYCNFFLHFIQNRPLSDFHTLGKLLHFKPTSNKNFNQGLSFNEVLFKFLSSTVTAQMLSKLFLISTIL